MNATPTAGCVIVHNEAPINPHGSAYYTKTTTNIVKELIDATEVEGKAEGGYCSTLRRVILSLFCFNLLSRHLVTTEGAACEIQRHHAEYNEKHIAQRMEHQYISLNKS